MLILSRSVINRIMKMEELIPLVEHALVEFSRGNCVQPDKEGLDLGIETGLLEIFLGYLSADQQMAVKILNSRKKNPESGLPLIFATISLIDPDTGETLALIEGGSVTASRTAAASAVAARFLSRPESRRLALIGTGRQGRTHLEALLQVRPINQVSIYDIHRGSAETFRSESLEKYGIKIDIASSVEEAVKDADIIQLCTTTREPVLFGAWVRPGSHINSIASYAPTVRELDTELVLKSKMVTDSRDEALKGAGDLLIPIREGLISGKHLYAEIGEIAGGVKPGRSNPREITVYKSMGIAAEDVVAAAYLYRRALNSQGGIEISLED